MIQIWIWSASKHLIPFRPIPQNHPRDIQKPGCLHLIFFCSWQCPLYSSVSITGTPTKAGTFTLTVKVTDNARKTATESFSMAVSLIGDFNGDGVVNLSDHTLFVAAFGLSEGDAGFNAEMDMNGDGTINTADFLIFVSHFPNADQFF